MRTQKAMVVLGRARADLGRNPMLEPRIVELTVRFAELQRQGFRDAVDTVIELGQILAEAKPLLHRHYGKWLERLGVSAKTAHNYESLARLSAKQPLIIQRFKELGPSKLYRVGSMTQEGRRAVLKPRSADSLQAMTDREFAEVTDRYVARRAKVTSDMRAHGLRMKLGAWISTLERARIAGVRSAELRAGLRGDLAKLRQAAGLVARQVR